MKYSSDVNDMLVRLYNFMANNGLEFTTIQAYNADRITTGMTSKESFYKKFIDEIDYIKELAAVQPTVKVNVKVLFWIENDKEWIVASDNTETIKTFSRAKLNQQLHYLKQKPTSIAKTEVEIVETTNDEYLTK